MLRQSSELSLITDQIECCDHQSSDLVSEMKIFETNWFSHLPLHSLAVRVKVLAAGQSACLILKAFTRPSSRWIRQLIDLSIAVKSHGIRLL